jgi:MFS family permease
MEQELIKKKSPSFVQNIMSPIYLSRPFTLLWLGQLLSAFGSSVTMVILPLIVYSLAGSTVVMGTTMAMYMLPNVLVLPIAGLIVDRYDRIKLMLWSDIIRFLIMLILMVLVLTNTLTIGTLYGLIAVYGFMDGLFQPAYSALRAGIFSPNIRNAANALTQFSNQSVRLLGPVIGGVIVSALSIGFGFGLDAVTYMISFVCLLFLRKITVQKIKSSQGISIFHYKEDLIEGFNVLKQHSWLWITILAFSFINICYSGVLIVLVPWLIRVHNQFSPIVYGLAMTSSGVGAMIAALIFGSRQRWRHRGIVAYGGVLLSGLALLALPLVSEASSLIMLMAIEGFGIMVFSLIWETSLQELVPEEAFGRVVSLDYLGSWALLPLGYIGVGWLAAWIGGNLTISILAISAMVLAMIALALPSIRRFD